MKKLEFVDVDVGWSVSISRVTIWQCRMLCNTLLDASCHKNIQNATIWRRITIYRSTDKNCKLVFLAGALWLLHQEALPAPLSSLG